MGSLRLQHGLQDWDASYLNHVYKWGGWLARLRLHDVDRITFAVLQHKNWSWISTIAAANNGRQQHCRILCTWRWERFLYKFVGDHWMQLAEDKDLWHNAIPSFINLRLHSP